MEKYNKLEIEVSFLDDEDVITTSSPETEYRDDEVVNLGPNDVAILP